MPFLYIDLQKAVSGAGGGSKPPAPPKPVGAKASSGKAVDDPAGGEERKGWGQPVDHYSKTRYPESPNNKLGETDKSWVLPKGVAPQYGDKGNAEGATDTSGTSPKDTLISTTEPVEVSPAPPNKQAPKASSGSLLGGGAKDTVRDMKAPQMEAKDHQAIAAEATKQGNAAMAAKHGKIAQAKATLESSSEEDLVDDSAAISSAVHKDKEESSNKEADKAAKEFKEQQKNKAKDGAVKDDSAAINSAADKAKAEDSKKQDKDKKLKEKTDNKEADKASKEFKEKQKAKSKDDAVKDDSAVQAAAARDLHKERLAKEKAERKAKDDAIKQRRKEFDADNKRLKAEEKKQEDAVKKQKEADKKKLDKDMASKDEAVAKEAQKQYKMQQQERARKKRIPANPVEQAEHATHTNNANQAKTKAAQLAKEGAVAGDQAAVLAQVQRALDQHASQKHPPNATERKELNSLVSHVNRIHDEHEKIKAGKQKALEAQKKEHEKAIKEKVKNETKAAKDQEKKQALEAKDKAKAAKENGKVIESSTNNQRPNSSQKVGMGAYHSGRAAGSSANNAAESNSAGGLGSQSLGAIGSGVASTGHKLLSGKKKEEDKKTYRNGNVEQSSMSKGFYIDLRKAAGQRSPGIDSGAGAPTGVTGESIQEDDPDVGLQWDKEEESETEKALKSLLMTARSLATPKTNIFSLPPSQLTKVGKSVTLNVQSKIEFLRKSL